jgi:hypothetical protein
MSFTFALTTLSIIRLGRSYAVVMMIMVTDNYVYTLVMADDE